MRSKAWAVAFVCFSLLANLTSALAAKPESEKESTPSSEMFRIIREVSGERNPTLEEIEKLAAEHGYRRVTGPGTTGEVSIQSAGSNLSSIKVMGFAGINNDGFAIFKWDWTDGTWDYWNGPNDIVAMSFEDINGNPIPNLKFLSDGTGILDVYTKNGEKCDDGWIETIDLQKKGIAFRFADYTHTFGGDMCGDSGFAYLNIEDYTSASSIRIKGFYHHNYDKGTITSVGFTAGVQGDKPSVNLSVTYSQVPNNWQRSIMADLER